MKITVVQTSGLAEDTAVTAELWCLCTEKLQITESSHKLVTAFCIFIHLCTLWPVFRTFLTKNYSIRQTFWGIVLTLIFICDKIKL